MPAVVAPLAAGFGAFIGGVFVSGTAALVATAFASFVLGVVVPAIAFSAISRALRPKFSALNSTSPIQLSRGPAEERRVIYGEVRVGGALIDAIETGAKNEFAHLVVAHASHECESIGAIWFNDEVVPLDGAGLATGPLAGLVRIKRHLGEAGQAADADLIADTFGQRTATDRFTGICYTYARLKFDQAKFPSGIPSISALVRGRKVFDPRTALTAWSANPALCIRDYLTNADFGLGISEADINDATFIAAANACDTPSALAGGGTEPLYRLHGTFTRSEGLEPATVLEAMLATMAGTLAYVCGEWQIAAGVWQVPTVTLDESDLRGPIDVQTAVSLADSVNRVRGRFTSPADNYQETDFPAVARRVTAANLTAGATVTIVDVGDTDWVAIGAPANATGVTFTATGPGTGTGRADPYLGTDGGVPAWADLSLGFVQSAAQAQRLARIALEENRRGISVKMPCKLTARRAQAGCTVLVTNAECGWVAKPFRVTELRFAHNASEGSVTLDVDLVLRETSQEIYEWTAADEQPYVPASGTNLRDIRSVPAVTGLGLSGLIHLQPDGSVSPRLRVTWAQSTEQSVLEGGRVEVEFRETGSGGAWLVWSQVRGDATEDVITDVRGGVTYDVRVRFVSHFRVAGPYADGTGVAGKDTTAPATPTGLTLVVGTGKSLSLDWDDSAALDHAEYGVYRSSTSGTGPWAKVAETASSRFVDVDVDVGTTYYYAVTDIDRSENESAKTVSVSGVPVAAGGLDLTPPGTPAAPVFIGEAAYLAADGTALAAVNLQTPALPALAVGINVLVSLVGVNWRIVGQVNGPASVWADDLSAGQTYFFALQAFSASGVRSAVSPTLMRTMPNSGAPLPPTNVRTSIDPKDVAKLPVYIDRSGLFLSITGGKLAAGVLKWTPSASQNVAFQEIQHTGSLGFPGTGEAPEIFRVPADLSEWPYNTGMITPPPSPSLDPSNDQFWRVRSVSAGGLVRSAWATAASTLVTFDYGTGDLAEQSKSAVSVSSLYLGSEAAASPRPVLARFAGRATVTLAGGGVSETANVSISGRGFSTRPDGGFAYVATNSGVRVYYDVDAAGSTSSNAVFRFQRFDGAALSAGSVDVVFELLEW